MITNNNDMAPVTYTILNALGGNTPDLSTYVKKNELDSLIELILKDNDSLTRAEVENAINSLLDDKGLVNYVAGNNVTFEETSEGVVISAAGGDAELNYISEDTVNKSVTIELEDGTKIYAGKGYNGHECSQVNLEAEYVTANGDEIVTVDNDNYKALDTAVTFNGIGKLESSTIFGHGSNIPTELGSFNLGTSAVNLVNGETYIIELDVDGTIDTYEFKFTENNQVVEFNPATSNFLKFTLTLTDTSIDGVGTKLADSGDSESYYLSVHEISNVVKIDNKFIDVDTISEKAAESVDLSGCVSTTDENHLKLVNSVTNSGIGYVSDTIAAGEVIFTKQIDTQDDEERVDEFEYSVPKLIVGKQYNVTVLDTDIRTDSRSANFTYTGEGTLVNFTRTVGREEQFAMEVLANGDGSIKIRQSFDEGMLTTITALEEIEIVNKIDGKYLDEEKINQLIKNYVDSVEFKQEFVTNTYLTNNYVSTTDFSTAVDKIKNNPETSEADSLVELAEELENMKSSGLTNEEIDSWWDDTI